MLKEVEVPQEEANALRNLRKNSRRRERNVVKNVSRLFGHCQSHKYFYLP